MGFKTIKCPKTTPTPTYNNIFIIHESTHEHLNSNIIREYILFGEHI